MMSIRVAAVALTLAGAVLGVPGAATAQKPHTAVVPAPGPGDPRIREVMYDPNQVVQLTAHLGFELPIEFDPEERIENVALGDSLSWQATPNRKATLLFLKPMTKGSPTSMTVVTNKRIYTFLLTTTASDNPNDPAAMLRVRFLYPKPPRPAPPTAPAAAAGPDAASSTLNFAYTYKGAKAIEPARVFDNGEATYFQFGEVATRRPFFSSARTARKKWPTRGLTANTRSPISPPRPFVLRYGKAKLEVRNTSWGEKARGPKSPGKEH